MFSKFNEWKSSAKALQLLMNVYPPLLGAQIRTTYIAKDFRAIDVKMPLTMTNRNYVGTHFGGSLFAMADPYLMLMFIRNLGPKYIVWDLSTNINFKAPGKGTVTAHFRISQTQIDLAKAETENGEVYRPVFEVDVIGVDGEVVAEISKTLYIRRKTR